MVNQAKKPPYFREMQTTLNDLDTRFALRFQNKAHRTTDVDLYDGIKSFIMDLFYEKYEGEK